MGIFPRREKKQEGRKWTDKKEGEKKEKEKREGQKERQNDSLEYK